MGPFKLLIDGKLVDGDSRHDVLCSERCRHA